jgi:hypothetical protein
MIGREPLPFHGPIEHILQHGHFAVDGGIADAFGQPIALVGE